MANVFDQFDKAPADTAPMTAGPAVQAIPQVNPFDQFDRQRPVTPPKEDLMGQAGAGIVTGIPNMVAGLADMMEQGTVQGAIDVYEYPGKMLDLITKGEERAGTRYKPVTGDLIRKGLSAAKINPNDYFAEPTTPSERMARMAGEGAITSVMPGGQQKGWAKLAEVAKNMFSGTVGGAAAQGAMEIAPDEWDGLAGLAGGLAGGIGGYGIASLPGAAVKGAKKGADYLAPAFPTKTNVERLAAERVAGAATDPEAAASAIGTSAEIVAGSKPTSFQASGDVGLGTLERAMARGDDKFKAALIDRVGEQNAARVAALEGIEESGDVGAAVQFFRDRMRALEEHADTLYDRAEKAAKGEYEGLGDRAAGDVGEAAREAIAARFKQMNGEASALWNSIDPDGTMNVTTEPLITETAKIYGRMSPEEKLSLSPDEKAIAGIIGSYGEILPFSNFKELRSEITRAMRKAKSFADPNDKAHRRLTMLRGAVEKAVEDSVAGKFTADAALVDDFVRRAKEFYDASTSGERVAATGTGPAARNEGSAAEPAPGVPVRSGEAGDTGGQPAASEGDTGLPKDGGEVAARTYPIAPRDEWYGEANFQDAGGKMRDISPDEFLARARPLELDEVARDNIDDLKRHIESGRTLDPLKFFDGGKEDGRHRAIAAKELGIDKVPVIEFGDQIDRGAHSVAPKMLDEAGAKRFSDATAATREIKDVFGAKPVKQMLRRPGPTYPYEMTAEGVANNLFKAGPEGAAAIKAAMRAGAPRETIEAAAVASLKRAASKDGTIDPTKLAAWRQKHADALREVPELERRMGSAAKATEAMVDIAQRRKEAVEQVQRSAVGRLLKVEDDADVSAVLGRMLGRDTAVKDMRSLVAEARNDPAAMAGLRRAVVDHMVSRLKTPKDALRSDTFQRYLGKNAPALSQVLTPEQMGSLRRIAMDLKRASKDVRSPGGGSDTAENEAAMEKYGVSGGHPSLLGALFRQGLMGAIAGAPAHVFANLFGGPVAMAVSAIASSGLNITLQHLRAKGIAKVDDLVREAILDPELMRRLLAKAPKRKDTGSADALRRWLGQNAFNDLLVNIGDEEKEWRGSPQRQRPSDAGKFSPEMGVRG